MAIEKGDPAHAETKRRGMRTASLLWWIAATLGVVALVLEYIKTGTIRWPQALFAFSCVLLAVTTGRAKRK